MFFVTDSKTKSLNTDYNEHQGIFIVAPDDLQKYCEIFSPQLLVNDKRAAKKARGLPVSNYGAVKGQTYNRVLIIPTNPIERYLCSGNIADVDNGKEKLYVAITRARFSVAFMTTCSPQIPNIVKWIVP